MRRWRTAPAILFPASGRGVGGSGSGEGLFSNRRLGLALLDAVRGLAAVHRAGLTHGNLRPDVLRVDPDGRVLVAGLGDDEATVAEAARHRAGRLRSHQPLPARPVRLGSFLLRPRHWRTALRRSTPRAAVQQRRRRRIFRHPCSLPGATAPNSSADELAADLERVLQTETVRVPWGIRVLLILEGILLIFGGAAVIVLVAKLGFGYQQSENGTFPEFMVLGAPALLYLIFTEVFLGRTPLRRWLGHEVADLSGDPAGRGQRLSRAALKIGLLAGWPIAIGWFSSKALIEQDAHGHLHAHHRVHGADDLRCTAFPGSRSSIAASSARR